jgi:DNA topoisomerase-1
MIHKKQTKKQTKKHTKKQTKKQTKKYTINTSNTSNTSNTIDNRSNISDISSSSNSDSNNNVNYNKRQFWPYQRFYGKLANKLSSVDIKKSKKIFHLINNKIATDKDLVNRLSKLYIPPAYTDLVVAKSANNKIQVIGTDNRGRRQYIYNSNYVSKRNDRKYDDILELGKTITAIENDNNAMLQTLGRKDLPSWNLPSDFIPIIIYMLRTYHFRIGNERYANENKSYGITTLRNEHIRWDDKIPNKFTIEFIGKKGILNRYTDENALMTRLLTSLRDNAIRNNDGYLFKYNNGATNREFITPDQIQTFFQDKYNAYITPKMFRTWYGNYHLLDSLRDMYQKGDLKHRLKMGAKHEVIKKCSEYVSNKLNNTPTVSKQSYIDNKILDLVMRNPYRLARIIPDTEEGRHKLLYKIITKLRNSK